MMMTREEARVAVHAELRSRQLTKPPGLRRPAHLLQGDGQASRISHARRSAVRYQGVDGEVGSTLAALKLRSAYHMCPQKLLCQCGRRGPSPHDKKAEAESPPAAFLGTLLEPLLSARHSPANRKTIKHAQSSTHQGGRASRDRRQGASPRRRTPRQERPCEGQRALGIRPDAFQERPRPFRAGAHQERSQEVEHLLRGRGNTRLLAFTLRSIFPFIGLPDACPRRR
jgi:hypothetical protein